MTGGRIGKDGIHGATFSSEELHEGSPATAVQIGDPITQKKMTDFLLEARDRGLYRAITDNGAGGLSSSVGEMARRLRRLRARSGQGARSSTPGLQPLGDPPLRGPGTHDPGRAAGKARRLPGPVPQRWTWRPRSSAPSPIPAGSTCRYQGRDRRLSRHGLPPRRAAAHAAGRPAGSRHTMRNRSCPPPRTWAPNLKAHARRGSTSAARNPWSASTTMRCRAAASSSR